MRVKGATLQHILLGSALLFALCWNVAYGKEIKHLSLEQGATGTRAEVLLDVPADYKLLTLANPDRLVLDLPGVTLPKELSLPPGSGVVNAVRSGHPVAGVTRIVFDLSAPVAVLQPHTVPAAEGGVRLILQWPGDGGGMSVASSPAARAPGAQSAASQSAVSQAGLSPAAILAGKPVATSVDPVEASAAATSRLIASLPLDKEASQSTSPAVANVRIATGQPARVASGVAASVAATSVANASVVQPATPPAPTNAAVEQPAPVKTIEDVMRGAIGMRPLIIAIDPGHGGQDPGAIGKSGRREKDVVLAISRELAQQINATPGLKAYLTRDSDVFIPLNKRARLARAANADMFISIHANAAENRSANGSSVFVLSLRGASSQRARWLADKENASDMIGGVQLEKASNTLASVLIDLTQSGQMKASADAAQHVLGGLDTIGDLHKSSIEHANFAVLRTSDMPAMLVETAFISNPTEERQLADPDYQRKLAGAVLSGINTYFTRQPPPGTLYAARASAAMADSADSRVSANAGSR